ncbi:uncharacterized protein LOC108023442 [Drosophila biarmipes]|uniref:uncharacterized protein LOC108023442 n=1 Tax=Drosophila biarmipes TaxID=125945 RepID=UPI0007E765FA|nr:uncharacterized protein LOC108023442 [Drosophila biarmipes]
MLTLRDLNLTKDQIQKLQQMLKEESRDDSKESSAKDEPQPSPSKGEAIAQALGNVQVYVEVGRPEAFVQLKQPLLHKFEVTPKGVATGCSESDKFNRADSGEIARWQTDKVINLDLVSRKDAEQFGKIQTDARTGETYMIVPMDINILVDKTTLTPDEATKTISEYDAYKEETGPGRTFYLYHELEGHPCKLPQAALDQNPHTSQVEPVPPENRVDWDYHMHDFEVPPLSFPFELSFDPDMDRLEGGEAETEMDMEQDSENPDQHMALAPEDINELEEFLEDMEL